MRSALCRFLFLLLPYATFPLIGPGRAQPCFELLGAGRYGIEAMANLAAVPPRGATVVVGAPKHAGGTGGPCRVLALV